MSEFKGTKGQWIASTGVPVEIIGKKPRGGDYVVARCGGNNRVENGRLIAAAPDLLKAIDALLERYTGIVNSGDAGNWEPEEEAEVIASRAAIAKALGQTEPAQ